MSSRARFASPRRVPRRAGAGSSVRIAVRTVQTFARAGTGVHRTDMRATCDLRMGKNDAPGDLSPRELLAARERALAHPKAYRFCASTMRARGHDRSRMAALLRERSS